MFAGNRQFHFGCVILAVLNCADRARGQGYSPQEAIAHMTTADGLKVSLFASEPEVRQPIFVKCDDRGRVWTIQYLQYPNPAGLTRVKFDRWSRTEYDRVPEPPPQGPRGADRISILIDADGDGRAETARDFVNGLNLVTGVEFGHGGVYVLNVPYLLFYPDTNRDDAPDSDPQVLLTGFGMEDAQAMSNHLTWGPDGWLYGVNGSTTTCRIRGIEFQQGVWRYHPITKAFELFCEGGSNCYGLTFDAHGELYYSTNGGPFVHAVQGGYFYKTFGKHGPLHNLHAYHYFPELARDQVPGGPPTGGTIYGGDTFPAKLRNTFVAGNFLGHTVAWWTIAPQASTVRAGFGGVILDTHDTWSGPTDVCLAPDGALYVSDFFDLRTAHPDPDANWDRSNGRIYRIQSVDAQPAGPFDLATKTSEQLVDMLLDHNRWFVDRARVELAARRDPSIVGVLRQRALQTDDPQLALQSLWALNATTDFNDDLSLQLLEHPDCNVRSWTVRLLGDRNSVSRKIAHRLAQLACTERATVVRSQLAASAKRLPAVDCLAVVTALLESAPDDCDPRIPWLIWWAIERHSVSDSDLVTRTFGKESMWTNPAARENNLRLVRRLSAEGSRAGYDACVRMLESARPDFSSLAEEQLRIGLSERALGLQGIGQGDAFKELAADAGESAEAQRQFETVGGKLLAYIEGLRTHHPRTPRNIELAVRANLPGAQSDLRAFIFDSRGDDSERLSLLALLAEFASEADIERVMELVRGNSSEELKLAGLDVLATLNDPEIAAYLIAEYSTSSPAIRSRVRDQLFSRSEWATRFLRAVDAGQIPRDDVPTIQLRKLALLNNKEVDDFVRRQWGNISPGTSEEKLATVRRLTNDLRAAAGNVDAGKLIFKKTCANCHQFHGLGTKLGPDLTTANRTDRAALLTNIVDPSAVIRKEFLSYTLTTKTGRIVTGLMAEQDAASLTILDANFQRTRILRSDIDEIAESRVSLMPERLLEPFSPQDLRNLFAYLQESPH